MSEAQTISYHPGTPTTIYCGQCGQAMRVAPQHLNVTVACPHCRQPIEPRAFANRGPARGGHDTPPPPPRYAYEAGAQTGYSQRNRWVAGALGILLGGLGVHRFYLGSTGLGLTQALLSILSLGILYPAIAIWGLIEGILCFCGALRDGDGLPLSG